MGYYKKNPDFPWFGFFFSHVGKILAISFIKQLPLTKKSSKLQKKTPLLSFPKGNTKVNKTKSSVDIALSCNANVSIQ